MTFPEKPPFTLGFFKTVFTTVVFKDYFSARREFCKNITPLAFIINAHINGLRKTNGKPTVV